MSRETESPAEQYIGLEMSRAAQASRTIDDTAAKLIAGFLHSGQASSFYHLASSGAVNQEGIASEVVHDDGDPQTPDWMKTWLDHLGTYAVEHAGRDAVPGWYELTQDDRLERLLKGEAS